MSEEGVPAGLSRETTIRRDVEGRWWHDGEPVTNPGVARAFDRWVDVAEDGRFCLRNQVNWAYVEIEGPPVFVDRARPGPLAVELELSDGRTERLDPETLRSDSDGNLYCDVRDGRMTAGFRRRAMLDLVESLDEGEGGVLLCLEQAVHPIPVVEDPLPPRGEA